MEKYKIFGEIPSISNKMAAPTIFDVFFSFILVENRSAWFCVCSNIPNWKMKFDEGLQFDPNVISISQSFVKWQMGFQTQFGSKRFHQNKYLNNRTGLVAGSDQNLTFN